MPPLPSEGAPPGLVRSIQGLFQGEPAEAVQVHEPRSRAAGAEPLALAVTRLLAAEPPWWPERADEVRAHALALAEPRVPGEGDAIRATEEVADAVERLASAGVTNAEAPALARELLTPGAARRLVGRLEASVRDEARRDEMVAAMGVLGPGVTHELADALAEAEDRSVRRGLMDALAAAAQERPEVLTELLADPRWFVVRNGVTVLGEVGGKPAVEHLTRALGHEHPRVRREAIMALARIGGADAEQLILGMLDDPDDGVRGAAAMALGVLGVERALRPLLARLDEESSGDVQEAIIRALGQLGDPGAVSALEKRADPGFFSRTPTSVRVAAYRALAAIGTPHARKVLEAGLEAREPEIRNAVRAVFRERG
jgi:HEAT repeat protein